MLTDLLQWASEITGVTNNSAANRATLLRRINRAAREIYDGWDIPGSVAEATFNINNLNGYSAITIPWYAANIRAVRFQQTGRKVNVVSEYERFNPTPNRQPPLQWRIVKYTPLTQSLSATGTLTVSFPSPLTEPVNVYIRGQTANGAMITETLSFILNDTTKTTANQFTAESPNGIIFIGKSAITAQDASVAETSTGTVIATIPNCLTEARNCEVMISDPVYAYTILPLEDVVEVLYKKPFIDYYFDGDQHLSKEVEQAVIWKLQEHWFAAQKDNELAMSQATLAYKKSLDVLQAVCQNQESGQERSMQYTDNNVELAPLNYLPFMRYGASY